MNTCAILFVKNPELGKVKTRLHSHLSAREATGLYRAFLLDSAETLAASQARQKVIAYAPGDAGGALETLLTSLGPFVYKPQPEGDLGVRLESLVQWSFGQGAERTVVLGSDSPSLPVEYIDRGLELLKERDIVLGPSTDGGYYLVGQRRGESRIFSDMNWSTGEVLAETLERLGEQSLALLPPWYDVDTPTEAAFLRIHLQALKRAETTVARHSLALLQTMELPSPS